MLVRPAEGNRPQASDLRAWSRSEIPPCSSRQTRAVHAEGIAAIDMFVVASASFRLLYVMIILGHPRRKIVRTAVAEHPAR